MSAEVAVLRLFHCRPLRVAFDTILREVMLPDLRSRDGMCWAVVGRQGPDDLGLRLVVSLWRSREAMDASMGGSDVERSTFHPEYLAETTDRRIDVIPVLHDVAGPPGHPSILRLATGELPDAASLAAYAAQVEAGARSDIDAGHAPHRLVIGSPGASVFVTISTWAAWADIERATGATLQSPIHTRGITTIERFSAQHLEVLPL